MSLTHWIILLLIISVIIIRWAQKIRKNVEWSRAKGLVVYGPEAFGHHFVYVDSNYKIAIFLPKADKTLHIFIGGLTHAKRWIKYDSSGAEVFDKDIDDKELEWKIDRDKVRYRGYGLKSTAAGLKGKVVDHDKFTDLINPNWILRKKEEMYQIYQKGILPMTSDW